MTFMQAVKVLNEVDYNVIFLSKEAQEEVGAQFVAAPYLFGSISDDVHFKSEGELIAYAEMMAAKKWG